MDKLIPWFVLEDQYTVARICWFTENFKVTDFDGIDKMLFQFLYFCGDMGVKASRKNLEGFLKTDGKRAIIDNNIRLDTMSAYDYKDATAVEEAYKVINTATFVKYDELSQQEVEHESFKLAVNDFMVESKARLLQTMLFDTVPKLNDGSDIDITMEELEYNISDVRKRYDKDRMLKLDFIRENQKDRQDAGIMRFVTDTGIPAIDEKMKGTYTRQVIDFSARPGTGKTRFNIIYFGYRAATEYHEDVLIDELELSKIEVENIMIAHHISKLFPEIKIPDSIMNTGELTTEFQKYYDAARIDLFETPGKYGNIIIRDEGLVIETMESDMYKFFRNNKNIALWIVDYTGFIRSVPQTKYAVKKDATAIINDAYIIAKGVCKDADVAGILINQFNKEGVAAADKDQNITEGMIQGGQASARTSDYSLVMTCNSTEKERGIRHMYSIKERGRVHLPKVTFQTDLAISIWRTIKSIKAS